MLPCMSWLHQVTGWRESHCLPKPEFFLGFPCKSSPTQGQSPAKLIRAHTYK